MPASTYSPSSAISRSISTRFPAAAAGSSRFSEARSATCCPKPGRCSCTTSRRCSTAGDDDYFLLGTDLVKDVARLEAAYDDAQGVTAEFNKNVLHVINRELDADFDVDAFDHVAVFDTEREWIEMRLRSTRAQTVHVRALELEVEFAAGEEMRTEVSAKFTRERVDRELRAAGMELVEWWTDPGGDFALSLARRRSGK